jgi:hypothetical protein
MLSDTRVTSLVTGVFLTQRRNDAAPWRRRVRILAVTISRAKVSYCT